MCDIEDLHFILIQYNVTYNNNLTATELRSIEIANTVNMVSAIILLCIHTILKVTMTTLLIAVQW